MKTFYKILGLCVALAVSIQFANAQDQTVSPGSTHQYEVTNDATVTYHWSVTGGTATDLSIVNTNNTGDIDWGTTPGTYTITVYPEKIATSCLGDNVTFDVEIVGTSVSWNVATANECPATDNSTPNVTITATFSGITVDASNPWSFEYSVDGGAAVASGNITTTTFDLDVDATHATLFNNASGSDQNHTIRISKLTAPDGAVYNYDGTEGDAAAHLFTLTTYPEPTTSAISVAP